MELKLKSPKYGEKIVLIDDEDYDLIKNYHWVLTFVRGKYYVVHSFYKNKKYNFIKMHRLIMNVLSTPKVYIDHKDGNGLNNSRSNLRIASVSQNTSNTPPNIKNTTGYKGVSQLKSNGRYAARLLHRGNDYFGGYFATAEEAAKKYNELALIHHGEFAYINKIPNE